MPVSCVKQLSDVVAAAGRELDRRTVRRGAGVEEREAVVMLAAGRSGSEKAENSRHSSDLLWSSEQSTSLRCRPGPKAMHRALASEPLPEIERSTHEELGPLVRIKLGAVERVDEVVVLKVGPVFVKMVLPGCGRRSATSLDECDEEL